MKKLSIIFLFSLLFILSSWIIVELTNPPLHHVEKIDPIKVKQGFEIVTKGFTTDENGKKTKRQSKHFTCIDCHNTKAEFDDLSIDNAENRLTYCKENNLPFLPGSSLYGIVNRTSWYNDDYIKKYGDLVTDSRDTLRNAIQLCATVCSQGRALEDWEMDAMLHYLWSISLTNKDIKNATSGVVKGYQAHFLETLPLPQRKLGLQGNMENGKYIYDNSCLQCHDRKYGPAKFKLDNSKLTFKMLARHFNDFSDKSIYQIIRHGTYPEPSNKPYMPLFTKEKMSDSQIEDLAKYILESSKL